MESGEIKAKKSNKVLVAIIAVLLVIAAIVTTVVISSGGEEKNIKKRLALADRYLTELKYDEAIAEYTAILEIAPKCTEAYTGIATAYKAQDNYPAVIQILEEAKERYAGDEFPAVLKEFLDEAYEIAKNGEYLKDWTDKMVVFGDATFLEDGSIELTPLDYYRSGCIWLGGKVKSELGFVVSFSYWAGGGRDLDYGGADGFSVAFAESPELGMDGGYLGFPYGAVGLEIDSYPYNENEPSGKHFAIIKGDVSNHVKYVIDDRTDDSEWHTVTMLYHNSKLEVYLDSGELLSLDNVSLPKESYIGISASTGSGVNRHLIRDFNVTAAAMTDEFDDSLLRTYNYAPTGDGGYLDGGYGNYDNYQYDENAYASIETTSDGVITIRMTADSIREKYTVGVADVEQNHLEYDWHVSFSDGNNTFIAAVQNWRFGQAKTEEKSIYDMQRSLWYNGRAILDIENMQLSGNTITLSFKIPKEPPSYSADVVIPEFNYANAYIVSYSGVVEGKEVSFGY